MLSRDRDDRTPLIAQSKPDPLLRFLVGVAVGLLGWLCLFAYNGNREIGVLAAEFRQNTSATDRRITALEAATERRLTVLENRVERIWEDK